MSFIQQYIFLFLKGIAMGAADVVPGVSGGTIAFITGIYAELLNSIKSINLKNVKLLFSDGPKAFWQAINGTFLAVLLSGIAISLVSLSKVIKYLLAEHPVLLWAFFFGLVLASAIYIMRQINKWSVGTIVAIIAGTIIAFLVTVLTPSETTSSLPYLFFCGSIAICAMILPGISGSFILLLLGQYAFIIGAIDDRNIVPLIVFAAGCGVGLLLFSRVLTWTFENYYNTTLAFLTGFLIGSLNKIWPWKQTLETYIGHSGTEKPLVQENVLPETFSQITGEPSHLLMAVVLMVVGFSSIFVLEGFATKKPAKH